MALEMTKITFSLKIQYHLHRSETSEKNKNDIF